jgi:UDP-N-acetylglucosamine 2-epimerase (non-hydrolysing)
MLLISFGTRPEYIKLKPVIDVCRNNSYPLRILFTGQHLDLLPSSAFEIIDMRLDITAGKNRLDSIVQSTMNNDHIFNNIKHVMIQGDTTSAFSMALAAFHRKIPVIHLEAGLRTWNHYDPYPEEFNRQSISALASIHLCPTKDDANNLRQERVSGDIHIVGNTVLDNLRGTKIDYTNNVYITMHRRENHEIMNQWFEQFENIANKHRSTSFCFISHPNPNVKKNLSLLSKVKVIEPVQHDKFISMLASCKFMITDSGGIQEESCFLRKKSIVCRKTTERTASLGLFSRLCLFPMHLEAMVADIINDYTVDDSETCPYGDGFATVKIFNIIKQL